MKLILFLLLPVSLLAQTFSQEDVTRWQQQAKQVTIIRDKWGIPHIYGKTDADCVFGLLYAQCEDDFKRVEGNYIEILGRTAEVYGDKNLYKDLYTRLLIDSAAAKKDYQNSPAWLKKLLQSFADGINYYLYKNPSVKPALIKQFEPWFHLMFTDGSISAIKSGGLTIDELKKFYTTDSLATTAWLPPSIDEGVTTGSNGFALAPSRTASGKSILYINPHVSFYFRPEVHMVSEEGLNTYGAVTWGQMFVYQGFNEHCGWMHTSGYSDVSDLYAEKIVRKNSKLYTEHNGRLLTLREKPVTLKFKNDNGQDSVTIKTWSSNHGPIMGNRNEQWLSVRANNRSLNSLIQSWERTKSNGLEAFKKTMMMVSNASNNTIFADDSGHIAYWHGNFIPRRDTTYDWSKPVDGTTRQTVWRGVHTLEQTIHLYNPASGFIQNCNSTPFTAAGSSSPKQGDYPSYMAVEPENFRGVNAVRLLEKAKKFTLDSMIAVGYNTYLPAFDELLPALINRYEQLSKTDTAYTKLAEPIAELKRWNKTATANSIATALAVEWGQKLQKAITQIRVGSNEMDMITRVHVFASSATTREMIDPLLAVVNEFTARYGTWKTTWGAINRYQRLTGNLQESYDDGKPSIPVGMVSAFWGCLPSYVSQYSNGSSKRYGYVGNSFVCAVEFGKKLKAKALLTGGQNSDPASKHFNDQAEMYSKGTFRDVLFYKEDVLKSAERTYKPGEAAVK